MTPHDKRGETAVGPSAAPARFGAYLRASRTDRALSRADIARWTRIPLRTIALLEEGEFDSLPAEVFVRGFLRSYALKVGIDPEATLRAYDASRAEYAKPQVSHGQAEEIESARLGRRLSPRRNRERLGGRARIAAALLAMIVLTALAALYLADGV